MIIECPHCGKTVTIKVMMGRKRLNMSVKIVCDTLRMHGSVTAAAKELGCSRGYIYKVMKEAGIKLTE